MILVSNLLLSKENDYFILIIKDNYIYFATRNLQL